MTKELLTSHPRRINLEEVDKSLTRVVVHWKRIDNELDSMKIGRKEPPFTMQVKDQMISGYVHLDDLLSQGVRPFSDESISEMLKFNNRIHYGTDTQLMTEYDSAISANAERYYKRINPIKDWYAAHEVKGHHPYELAAEIYVAILGRPQLFIEGNHRAGTLIADYIHAFFGHPIFVLTVRNALDFFEPAGKIKHFYKASAWQKLNPPEYKKRFGKFWREHIDHRYLLPE